MGVNYPVGVAVRVGGNGFDQGFVGGLAVIFGGSCKGRLEKNFGQI